MVCRAKVKTGGRSLWVSRQFCNTIAATQPVHLHRSAGRVPTSVEKDKRAHYDCPLLSMRVEQLRPAGHLPLVAVQL